MLTHCSFEVYLAAPIVVLSYVLFKFIKKTKIKRAHEIDITSGRRELDLAEILAEERAIQAKWPLWKKGEIIPNFAVVILIVFAVYKTVC